MKLFKKISLSESGVKKQKFIKTFVFIFYNKTIGNIITQSLHIYYKKISLFLDLKLSTFS